MKKIITVAVQVAITSILAAQSITPKTNFSHVNREIIELFDSFPLVAIGEGMHNSALTAEWLYSLVNEKNFAANVRNIVVEFGTSAHQDIMDDFTSGKDVPDSLLQKCWRNTTQLFVWDNPIYEQFFREIRKLNQSLPIHQKVRVLLGDPPFEQGEEKRDSNAYAIIENEVLKKQQTALLIYGDLHFVRRDVWFNYAGATELSVKDRNLVQLLDTKYPGKVYSIWGSVNTNDAITKKIIEQEKITIPSLLTLTKSKIGNIDFTAFYPWANDREDAKGNPVDTSKFIEKPIREIVDAVIFRGTWEDQIERIAPRPEEIYADTVYVNELIRRATETGQMMRVQRFQFFKLRWSPMYKPLMDQLETMDSATIDKLFAVVKSRYADFRWMQVLNIRGYTLLDKKELNKAIATFQLATRQFPMSSNTYNSLGDAYLAAGNNDKAIASFRKALELDPSNQSSKRKLSLLEK